MSQVMRLFCRVCFHVVDSDLGDEATRTTCRACGGPVEAAAWGDEKTPDEYQTPVSLYLTPEERENSWSGTPAAVSNFVSTPPALIGSHVGRYQIRELLGGGGFGQVFRAYDPRLDRDVALKVLKDQHPTGRVMERFFREARAAAQLDHPNIVPLHEAGRDQGRCWIAYQFIKGRALGTMQFREMRNYDAITRLVRDLADALDHSHRHGVVHRDIKPSNILLDAAGRPRLTDFGLALRTEYDVDLTIEGTVLGTPSYMSPEQAAGHGHLADARSDIYSLGVIFYELLCGSRPSDQPSDFPAWRALTPRKPPVPPRVRDHRVPKALDRICRRSLELDPADRFSDARALSDDLDRFLQRRTATVRGWVAGLIAGVVVITIPVCLLIRHGPESSRPHQEEQAASPRETPPDAAIAHSHLVVPALSPTPVKSEEPEPELGVFVVLGRWLIHRRNCPSLDKTSPDKLRRFENTAMAKELGYKACGMCRPD